VKASVDGNRCTGHGRCYTMAPDVFDGDELGFNDLKGKTVDLMAELIDSARRGADACPEGAITVLSE
jgi:ferredoxin